jgi:hypothetical protein
MMKSRLRVVEVLLRVEKAKPNIHVRWVTAYEKPKIHLIIEQTNILTHLYHYNLFEA